MEFPNPTLPRSIPPAKNEGPLFTGLRIVDTAGHVLTSRGQGGTEWEFEDQGNLLSGTVSSFAPPSMVTLRVAADLEFFCGDAYRAAADVTALSASGRTITVHAACSSSWVAAASLRLDAGDWTISADRDAYYTVLPKEGPRP